MDELEKQIKATNRKTTLKNAFQELFNRVSEPFYEFKEYLNRRYAERRERSMYQDECRDSYNEYLAFADQSIGKRGVETSTNEKGKTITIVYTDHGPLIKTQTQFRRLIKDDPESIGEVVSTYQGFFKDDKDRYEFRDLQVRQMTGWINHNDYYMNPTTEVSGFSMNLRRGEAISQDITLRTEYKMGCDKFLSKKDVCTRYHRDGEQEKYDMFFKTNDEFYEEYLNANKVQFVTTEEGNLVDDVQEQ